MWILFIDSMIYLAECVCCPHPSYTESHQDVMKDFEMERPPEFIQFGNHDYCRILLQ